MSGTTDRPRRRVAGPIAAGLGLALLLGGCAEEPLPERRLTVDDCLKEVRLDDLGDAMRRCDRVVKAFPQDPLPLNERFLLHTLAGDDEAACRDIARAVQLARRIPAAKLDRMLTEELKLREAGCRSS